ncbi:unnamed protein product [Arabidopsis lyrata]|nr:unnamed protein product [Arabidopsis lyrata]
MHGLVIMGAVFVENTDPDKNLPRDEQGITPLLLKIRKSGKEDRFAEFLYFHCVVAAPFVFPYSPPSGFERQFRKELPGLYKLAGVM